MTEPRVLRITVELSRSPRRMWLKAVDNTGWVMLIRNIDAYFATDARNSLVERLVSTGQWDEITADPVPRRGQAPRLVE